MVKQTGLLGFTSVLSTLIFYHVWMDTQIGLLGFTSVLSTLIFYHLLSCLYGHTGWSANVH